MWLITVPGTVVDVPETIYKPVLAALDARALEAAVPLPAKTVKE
jgi:hypothetical protein